jgi:hypothetical protein
MRKGTGRRGVLAEIRQLVVRMAEDNPTWGYTRIQGALKNVGRQVGRSTIARILKAHGLRPAPQRPTAGQTFLRADWGAIAGADFFTTEVWTWRGLVTFYTVFVMDLATRRVEVLGTTEVSHDRIDKREPPMFRQSVAHRGGNGNSPRGSGAHRGLNNPATWSVTQPYRKSIDD